MYSEILYEVAAPIAKITLNRPERRNPLSPVTLGELVHALEAARSDDNVRVIVIAGAGKVFSAGGDLGAFAGKTGASGEPAITPASFVELNLTMAKLGKPTIARVHGKAMAGGLGLVVSCDVAIAADDVELGLPEINVGLWPMMISATIFRNVSRKRGLELMLTGDRISAATGLEIGLLTKVVPSADLDRAVEEYASKLVQKSPTALRLGLTAFYASQEMELEPALRYLQSQLMAVLSTEDAREGLTAFLEKRPPVWKGK